MFKNLTGIRWVYALAAVALVAVLVALIWLIRSVNLERSDSIITTLRDLKQVDAEWNVDVLRSKTGLTNNYDQIASPLPLIERLGEQLSQETTSYWQSEQESLAQIKPALQKFDGLMNEKIASIEQFKSQNAILRNSSQFLKTASNQLIDSAVLAGLTNEERIRLEREVNSLYGNTIAYTQNASDELRGEIDNGVLTLGQITRAVPESLRSQADTLIAHVKTVVRQQIRGSALLQEIAAMPTAAAIDALTDAHNHANNALLDRMQIYQRALTIYSALLLALLGFIGWRLMRNYQALNQSNEQLHKAHYELKESQVHLVQSEKMSALGQMVAGIAHEINTPLAYVKGTFDVLRGQLMPMQELAHSSHQFTRMMREPHRDKLALKGVFGEVESQSRSVLENKLFDDMQSLIGDGVHGIEQISEIVLNLKNFSRLDREKVENFSVEAGLDSTLLLARNILKDGIQIEKHYGQVPNVAGSPSQINQIFLNIISNAAHAMPKDGRIGTIHLTTDVVEGGKMVSVQIKDNGKGIPADVLPKIFDPFFTTKPIGEGTGMGLSISYKIVQEHGGRISVASEVGVGTVFTILLPMTLGAAAKDQHESSAVLEDEEDALFAD